MGDETMLKPWWDVRALDGNKVAKLRENAILYRGVPSLYWPLRRDTDSRLWPYAVACLEAAIKLSDFAVASYAQIVEAWELPGCQDIKNACLERWPDTSAWLDRMRKAYASKNDCPEIPGLASTYTKYEHNADFNTMILLVAQFVILNFNRHQDIECETYKVMPGHKSLHLTKAIAMRSIIDSTEYEAAKLRQYQHPDIDLIMTGPWPKYRTPEREIRSQITNGYKAEGHNLKADDTLLTLAEMWYRARVLCNTLREAANYYHLDAFDLSKRIRPCDDATGYRYRK
jgi:hypothetical protein